MDYANPVYNTRLGPGFGTFRSYFEELGGIEVLERVQMHINQEVFNETQLLLRVYFAADVTQEVVIMENGNNARMETD